MCYELDLKNPKTLNEKIQWLKIYDSSSLKTKYADKYLVRKHIKETIGEKYLIPLIAVYDKAGDINFDILPDQFVIKCNHGSGYVIIVRNKEELNKEETIQKLNSWMNINYAFTYGLELHYKNIKPKILIEEYIENEKQEKINDLAKNSGLYSYSFYCFNYKVNFIYIYKGAGNEIKANCYDINLNLLPFRIKRENLEKDYNPPKEEIKKMIKLSEKLAKDFIFVRVDWFLLNNKDIKFGELTFTPYSGTMEFIPKEWDLKLGEVLKLN